MIKSTVIGKEIAIKVTNEVGALAKITSFLINHGINIEAVSGEAKPVGEEAHLIFVTDNNVDALEMLRNDGYLVEENDIIIIELENRPGALKNISEILAQNDINITYIYATTCAKGCPTKIILSTSDNNAAIGLLRGE